MISEQITTPAVAESKGPYSQAIRVGSWLLISGQVAWNAAGDVIGVGDIEAQTRQVFANIAALCDAAGLQLHNVVQIRTYLTDITQAGMVSAIRCELFTPPYPTATTVQVSALIQPELLIEIEALAVIPDAPQIR